jgi:hypothetical protein
MQLSGPDAIEFSLAYHGVVRHDPYSLVTASWWVATFHCAQYTQRRCIIQGVYFVVHFKPNHVTERFFLYNDKASSSYFWRYSTVSIWQSYKLHCQWIVFHFQLWKYLFARWVKTFLKKKAEVTKKVMRSVPFISSSSVRPPKHLAR